jgi:hypothetical protein
MGQGRHVEDAFDPAGERVPDRVPVTAEPAQRLDEVLVAVDGDREVGLEGRAQAVGADGSSRTGPAPTSRGVVGSTSPGMSRPKSPDWSTPARLARCHDWAISGRAAGKPSIASSAGLM